MTKKIYDRQPGETAKAFEAFQRFLELGVERSLAKVSRLYNSVDRTKSRSQMARWSNQFDWMRRAQAWDDDIETARRDKYLTEIEEMNERHRRIARAIQSKLVDRLQAIDPKTLTPSDLIRWFEVSVNIERLTLGLTTGNGHNGMGEEEEPHEVLLIALSDPDKIPGGAIEEDEAYFKRR